jgi:hypothetical protein
MSIAFKPEETFRGDYSYRNSDAAILRFPFPFPEDKYMYSVNIEPHVRSGPSDVYLRPFDVDEHYIAECRDRAITLERDPGRCQVLPHMMLAQWDTLELLMENLSADYPEHFSLTKEGDDFGSRWTWTNRPWASSRASSSATPLRCPASPSSTSPARPRATSPSATSATTTSTWTPAWSPPRPTGPWSSTWA